MALTIRQLVTRWDFKTDLQPIDKADTAVKNLKSSVKLMAGAFIVAGAGVSVFLREAGRFEQTNIAFTTLLNSAEKAKILLAELTQFAIKTPFTLPGIEMSAKQLMAVGIETEDLIPTLKALGDVAAGLSVPLARLVLNYGQVKTQVRLTGRELRDFAIAGVPIIQELATHLNVTEKEIKEMVARGDIGFDKVRDAFISMTSEGGRFNNLMIKQSKSLFGILENTKDGLIVLARAIGNDLLPQAKALAKGFLDYLTVNKEFLKLNLGKFIKNLTKLLSNLWLLLKTGTQILQGFTRLLGGTERALGLLLLSLTMLIASRFLIGIGALTSATWSLASSWGAVSIAVNSASTKFLLIGAIIAGIFLVIEDIYSFLSGKESLFEKIAPEFFQKDLKVTAKAVKGFVNDIKETDLFGALNKNIIQPLKELLIPEVTEPVEYMRNKITKDLEEAVKRKDVGKMKVLRQKLLEMRGKEPGIYEEKPGTLDQIRTGILGQPIPTAGYVGGSQGQNISIQNKIDAPININVPPGTSEETIKTVNTNIEEKFDDLAKEVSRANRPAVAY